MSDFSSADSSLPAYLFVLEPVQGTRRTWHSPLGQPISVQCHDYVWVQAQAPLSPVQCANLADILQARVLTESALQALAPTQTAGLVVTPRLGTRSPWGSKAADIAALCGLPGLRLERACQYDDSVLSAVDQALLRSLVYDRMTHSVHATVRQAAAVLEPQAAQVDEPIAFMQLGMAALTAVNKAQGLSLGAAELQHLADYFAQAQRDPTLAELMMFAQANSEHCRHRIFNAEYVVDGHVQALSLFDCIRATHKATPDNTIVAYSDNAAIVGTRQIRRWQTDASGAYALQPCTQHSVLKAETHNHPTAISPFAGAATGAGGEIRDGGSTGRGSVPKAGMSAFTTSLLDAQVPPHLASPTRIMLDGPLGAAAFNNEFGRVALGGFWRAFEQQQGAIHYGYHKPIMLAAGWGSMRAEHAHKLPVRAGDYLVQIGGPSLRVGVGGGAASSMATGSNDAELDFASVQRDNPEMQRRAQMVINACVALAEANPIRAIHDVGAGGLSNALPEVVDADGLGARIDVRAIPLGESGMSAAQLWCNESQERYVLAIAPADRERFEALCARERCPVAVVGVATEEARFVVRDAQGASVHPIVDWAMPALLGGLPKLQRHVAAYQAVPAKLCASALQLDWQQAVTQVLTHPSVASKRFLITIGDRTVGGLTHRDPMVGPWQEPVADCAVTLLDFASLQAEAVAMGERMPIAVYDAEASVRMALAETLTNLAAAPVQGLPHIKLSCNWMAAAHVPGEDSALRAGVEATSAWCQALQLAVPVGKDSLSMQVKRADAAPVTSPLSLVVTAWSLCHDLADHAPQRVYTPELQRSAEPTCLLYLKAHAQLRLGASILQQTMEHAPLQAETAVPDVEAKAMLAWWHAWQAWRASGHVLAYHDVSDGGVFAALCEMAFAARMGLDVELSAAAALFACTDPQRFLFQEETAALVQVPAAQAAALCALAEQHGAWACVLAKPQTQEGEPSLRISHQDQTLYHARVSALHRLWEKVSQQFTQQRDQAVVVQQEAARLTDARYTEPGLPWYWPSSAQAAMGEIPSLAPRVQSGARPRVAILREQGVNSMQEMAYAWHAAGWQAVDVTMTDLIAGRHTLAQFQALAACGGFSFGDVLGAGGGWARSILCYEPLRVQFQTFFARPETLALGVCNGCQMLSQLDSLMPQAPQLPRFVHNASGRYEARLVAVEVPPSASVFMQGLIGARLPIPVAHGEGRVLTPPDVRHAQTALRYITSAGLPATQYPDNPNGSVDAIAGVCSSDGRITLLMPHPERSVRVAQLSWYPQDGQAAQRIGASSPWQHMFVAARQALG